MGNILDYGYHAALDGTMGDQLTAQTSTSRAAARKRASRSRYDAQGFRRHKVKLPQSIVDKLDQLKKLRRVKSRDVIVNSLIGDAAHRFEPREIPLPPPPIDTGEQSLPFLIHLDRFAYLSAVQHHHRGVPLGVALEAIIQAASQNDANSRVSTGSNAQENCVSP